ncbi:hypothetical protein [Sphingobium sp. CFD-2]|uniref:hypothetical protein n=1 Tax=Sphingobium sp. CFD-2 TaxID=2878542 RepID=UPI00214AB321|nr:hypothetical protein [Sphingobium sp. CFD-2]
MGDWGKALDILKASGGQTLAIAVAAGLFIWLSRQGIVPEPAVWMVIAAWAVMLVCGCLAAISFLSVIGRLLAYPRRYVLRRYQHWAAQRSFEAHIPHLTGVERRIFGYLLHHNHKTFSADVDGGYAAGLLGLGFIRIAARPGQQFDIDKCPMIIPDPVWSVLERRRDEFPHQEDATEGHPWRIHWMAR